MSHHAEICNAYRRAGLDTAKVRAILDDAFGPIAAPVPAVFRFVSTPDIPGGLGREPLAVEAAALKPGDRVEFPIRTGRVLRGRVDSIPPTGIFANVTDDDGGRWRIHPEMMIRVDDAPPETLGDILDDGVDRYPPEAAPGPHEVKEGGFPVPHLRDPSAPESGDAP